MTERDAAQLLTARRAAFARGALGLAFLAAVAGALVGNPWLAGLGVVAGLALLVALLARLGP